MVHKTQVLIVGAGPAGSACGISLQKAGVDCMLVDKQTFPRVKLCAGLFTQKSQKCLLDLLGQNLYNECMDACLMSHESEFSIYKGQTCLVTSHLDRPITLINRPKFDAWLVNHYIRLGGKFCDSQELIDLDDQKKVAVFREREVEYEYLIAADGANSTVERLLAKQYPEQFHRKAKSALSLEINVDRGDVDVTGVNIHLDIIPNSYAWTFAKGEKVCLGLVKQPDDTTNANVAMRQFLNDLKVRNQQKYPLQGAMIPVGTYMTRPAFRDKIMFVGDAAGFVEPLTDEGIYYALQSGCYAAKAFDSNAQPVDHYLKLTDHLKRMIDMGRYYQRLLEKPWAVNLLYKHAHKHPDFVAYFYETRIEQGCMDSFWKNVLHYKLLPIIFLLGVMFLTSTVSAQIPVDTTEFVPMSWKQAMRQRKYEWFVSKQARAVADSIVKYQLPTGGWVKNQDWGLNPDSLYISECMETGIGGTIDNGATYQEMEFLAKMYYYTNLIAYRVAFLNGLDFLLGMQYENGGWPQYYPPRGKGHYSSHITFNDNAMVNVMQFLLSISRNEEPYDMLWLKPEQREACKRAYDRGVECILDCQIMVDGQPTVWCQQHDEKTLKPAQARAYELPSFCAAGETVNIVELLLSLPNPSERIIMAIDGAIRWLENHKIEGKALERFTNEEGKADYRVVDRPGAPAMWARFYDLIHGEPLFCGRDGIPRKHVEDIEYERRNGYSWFGTQPQRLIDLYHDWSASVLDQYILYDEEAESE